MSAASGSHAENVFSIEVPVTVTVASRAIRLGDVLALAPGTILKLDQQPGQSLRIEAAGQHVGRGTAVKVGDQLGVKVQTS
jgi:flagellar motor switch protein FliN/FliY